MLIIKYWLVSFFLKQKIFGKNCRICSIKFPYLSNLRIENRLKISNDLFMLNGQPCDGFMRI